MAEEGNSIRAIIAAFAANLGIAVSKFVAFLFTGSSALLAEAGPPGSATATTAGPSAP